MGCTGGGKPHSSWHCQNWFPDSPFTQLRIPLPLVPSDTPRVRDRARCQWLPPGKFITLTHLAPHTLPLEYSWNTTICHHSARVGVFWVPVGHLKTAGFPEGPTSLRARSTFNLFHIPSLPFPYSFYQSKQKDVSFPLFVLGPQHCRETRLTSQYAFSMEPPT